MIAFQVSGGSSDRPRDALAELTGTLDDPRCSLAGEVAGRIRCCGERPRRDRPGSAVPGAGAVASCHERSIVRWVTAISAEDLTQIDRGGRRCSVCRSGRHWRRFEVVRPDGAEPVVMCAACRTRYGSALPVREGHVPAVSDDPAWPAAVPASAARERRPAQHEDRVKKALRELPRGEHSTGRIAKAAGLNHAKTLRRLRQLEASGGVREVGKRWSTEPPSSDLEGALDRLQARTSNIRIVRDRSPIG